jgi:CDP-4-dehydro-6-deoxyglucose reductase
MKFQINIKPSGHVFTVNEDETILQAALREGIGLPYGCRNGACGTCKGKLIAGEVNYGEYQESALSEAEKVSGMALFCCSKPQSDLTIESREINAIKDIPIKILPCRVEKIEKPTDDVAVLYLKLPSHERLQFLAGQYIDILLKSGKRRSFSMGNAPHDDQFLQLHIRNVIGGEFTDYVFTKMKEREIMRFEGPLGSFFLREDTDKPIIFVASGTGFAPVKSIIEHAFHKGIERQMVLYWGGRHLNELYMRDLPMQWQEQHKNFKFIPVLSEPRSEDQWQGRTGFVHLAVMEDFSDMSSYQVYACGSPVVVEAAHRDFTSQRKLPETEFFSDAFTFSNDTKIK